MSDSSTRRRFLGTAAALTGAGLGARPVYGGEDDGRRVPVPFSVDGTQIRIRSPRVQQTTRVTVIADTHLFRDDERGAPYREFSARMAGAYHATRHHITGEPTDPERGFEEALRAAAEAEADWIALVGDIVSFPSEAGVEWVVERMKSAGRPYFYTAGNHDWHYEGMDGSLDALRSTWSQSRLAPLLQQDDPLMSVRRHGGLRLVTLDNSTYELQRGQLDFFREQVASGEPMLLFVHIPLYAPGRSLGFGCGHPGWGAQSDRNAALERRVRWRDGGHTPVTFDFHREVFAAPNLLGIFAGHTHRASLDVVHGIPQFVTNANATAASLQVEVLPL